ncbi:DNA ligase 1-like [Eurosta solidaginis]|uniref:DNA ligase 1-like n=1 Tax=Eurosta solidaginis TaxID=178769 RepID=UPI003530C344
MHRQKKNSNEILRLKIRCRDKADTEFRSSIFVPKKNYENAKLTAVVQSASSSQREYTSLCERVFNADMQRVKDELAKKAQRRESAMKRKAEKVEQALARERTREKAKEKGKQNERESDNEGRRTKCNKKRHRTIMKNIFGGGSPCGNKHTNDSIELKLIWAKKDKTRMQDSGILQQMEDMKNLAETEPREVQHKQALVDCEEEERLKVLTDEKIDAQYKETQTRVRKSKIFENGIKEKNLEYQAFPEVQSEVGALKQEMKVKQKKRMWEEQKQKKEKRKQEREMERREKELQRQLRLEKKRQMELEKSLEERWKAENEEALEKAELASDEMEPEKKNTTLCCKKKANAADDESICFVSCACASSQPSKHALITDKIESITTGKGTLSNGRQAPITSKAAAKDCVGPKSKSSLKSRDPFTATSKIAAKERTASTTSQIAARNRESNAKTSQPKQHVTDTFSYCKKYTNRQEDPHVVVLKFENRNKHENKLLRNSKTKKAKKDQHHTSEFRLTTRRKK